jgi:hypothetical protein
MGGDDDLSDVPKLPRGRGLKLSMPEIFRILMTAGMLIAVLLLAHPCGDAVGNFMMKFDNGRGSAAAGSARAGSAGSAASQPTPQHYVQLKPGMTDEETKAAIERAKAQAGSGSAAAP